MQFSLPEILKHGSLEHINLLAMNCKITLDELLTIDLCK